MLSGPPRRHRARPVADAPIDALLDGAEELTKGWLLALLERAPLDDAPRILAADLTREGPRVCAAMLRAITDETDHRRLEPGGALAPLAARVGELAGATGAAATSLAVDALQAVVWAALRAEMRDPHPDLITELAERLSQVTELMRSAALARGDASATGAPPTPALAAVDPSLPAMPATSPPPPGASAAPPGAPPPPPVASAPPSMGSPPPVVSTAPSMGPPGPPVASAAPSMGPPPPPVASAAPSMGPPPPPVAPQASAGQPATPEAEPEPVRWAWGEHGPARTPPDALWVEALQEEINRTGDAPLSLLLAELEDADRVLAIEPEAEASGAFGGFARAVRGVARRQDILVCESDSRAWIIARGTARAGAQALGARIVTAVKEGELWRGAPLAASVGVAVLGEDGRNPDALIEAAEEARFAAAASGLGVLRSVPEDAPGEPD